MPAAGSMPLVHLSEAEVAAALPPPLEAVAMARRALVALADGSAQLPPKPSVHAREGVLANAMPAYLADGDLLGLKWIAAYPSNAELGLPTHAGSWCCLTRQRACRPPSWTPPR